jgi:hypothetical protein
LIELINKSKTDLYSKFSIGEFQQQLEKLPAKIGLNLSRNKKIGKDISDYVRSRQNQDLKPISKSQQLVSILSKIGSLNTNSKTQKSIHSDSRDMFRIKLKPRLSISKLPELRDARNDSWKKKISNQISPNNSQLPSLSYFDPHIFAQPTPKTIKSPSHRNFFKIPSQGRQSEQLVNINANRSKLAATSRLVNKTNTTPELNNL